MLSKIMLGNHNSDYPESHELRGKSTKAALHETETMTIHTWTYLREFENEREEILTAVEKVFRSGKLVLGESGKRLEADLASAHGVRHGIGVNSATDALFLGLKALGVGAGHEVITVSNTAVPTVSAIVSTGAAPRFVDIDPATYLMDLRLLEAAITPRTKCIIPVHLFGQCVAMDEVMRIARKHNLAVLEDCAQSQGATYKGKPGGSFGDLAALSFYPTKILGAYGDGGMILTNSDELDKRLRRLRFYGMDKTYFAEEHGYNSRLDEVQAEILAAKNKHLPEYLRRRRQLAKQYDQLLAKSKLQLPKVADDRDHVYHLYVCRTPERDRVLEAMKARGIAMGINYPWPIHTMPPYRQFAAGASLPETEAAAKEIFSLPLYPTLTDDEQRQIATALADLVGTRT